MYIEQRSSGRLRSAAIFGISCRTQIENELPIISTLSGLRLQATGCVSSAKPPNDTVTARAAAPTLNQFFIVIPFLIGFNYLGFVGLRTPSMIFPPGAKMNSLPRRSLSPL